MKFCVNCLKLEAEDAEDIERLYQGGLITELERIMAQVQLKEGQGESNAERE